MKLALIALCTLCLMAFDAVAQNAPTDPYAKFTWDAPVEYENGEPLAPEDIEGYTLTCTLDADPAVVTTKEMSSRAASFATAKEDLFPQYGAYTCHMVTHANGLTSRPSGPVTVTYIDYQPAPNPPQNVLFVTDSVYFE